MKNKLHPPPSPPPSPLFLSSSTSYNSSIALLLFLSTSPATPAAVSSLKSPVALVPNAKNVKQMLLDWCRAKTEPYEVSVCRLSLAQLVSYCLARTFWPLKKKTHTCTRTLMWRLFSACRGWTSTISPPAGRTGSPSAPWCTASSRMPSSTPSWTPTSPGITSSWPSAPPSECTSEEQMAPVLPRHCSVMSLLSFSLCLQLTAPLSCLSVCMSAGGWPAVPPCWTQTTWCACTSPTGSVCTPTSRSSTAAWWRKAWSKPRRGCRRLLWLSGSEHREIETLPATFYSFSLLNIRPTFVIKNE